MKKHLNTIIIAVIMTVLMVALSPVQTFAASQKQYISEIRMSDNREKLTELDYTVLDNDLNAGTGEGYTYIGYKTTTNPDEAITDISIMDMKGGYSFGDYEAILEQQKKAVAERIATYRIAINEFVERYKAGSKAAVLAYESLNGFIEDDSGKLLGDILIDPNLSDEDLIKITMQASMLVNSTIADYLAIGLAQDGEGNWLSRISEKEQTAPEAFDDAMILINAIDFLSDNMQSYLDTGLTLSDYEKNPDEFSEFTDEELADFMENGILYKALSQYKYKDGTVADLFMSESIAPEDLYPVIAALTPGQLAIAEISGFQSLIKAVTISDAIWDEAKEYADGTMKDVYGDAGKEKVSVYIGVDREMYNGGVALTSDAMRKSKSTGDNSWWYGNLNHAAEISMIMTATFSSIVFAVSFAVFKVFSSVAETLPAEAFRAFGRMVASNNAPKYVVIYNQINSSLAFASKLVSIANIAMWISGAIVLIMVGFYIGFEIYNYYNPKYTEIPLILMDLKFGENDEVGDWEKYIKYNVVLNEGGTAGDLNEFAAKQWNAMYVTKDKAAGNPILADSFTVQYGDSTTPRKSLPVHYFGSTDAVNLNSHCYDDDEGGIFMFFRSDNKAFASETASVFGSGALAAVTGFGGLVIGVFGAMLIFRKKFMVKA